MKSIFKFIIMFFESLIYVGKNESYCPQSKSVIKWLACYIFCILCLGITILDFLDGLGVYRYVAGNKDQNLPLLDFIFIVICLFVLYIVSYSMPYRWNIYKKKNKWGHHTLSIFGHICYWLSVIILTSANIFWLIK